MKKLLIFLFLFSGVCYAGNISDPPVDNKISIQLMQYLKEISDNFNQLEVVTTNPDGSRLGNYGDIVLLITGGNYYVEICVSSPNGTVWRGVQLQNSP